MSIVKMITKNFTSQRVKSNDVNIFYESFSNLSHDLKNNFVAIRAASGNIKQCINIPDIADKTENIEKALLGIDKKINHSITLLNMMTIFSSPTSKWPTDIADYSMINCIQHAINNYPFTSDKHALYINVISHDIDFTFRGSFQLISSIFYCLIKNAMHSLYNSGNGEAIIEIEKDKVNFKFTDNAKAIDSEHNLFALGQPNNPGNGLTFITNVLKSMNGNIVFKKESDEVLVITLFFSL